MFVWRFYEQPSLLLSVQVSTLLKSIFFFYPLYQYVCTNVGQQIGKELGFLGCGQIMLSKWEETNCIMFMRSFLVQTSCRLKIMVKLHKDIAWRARVITEERRPKSYSVGLLQFCFTVLCLATCFWPQYLE